jgi:hypothetical protein
MRENVRRFVPMSTLAKSLAVRLVLGVACVIVLSALSAAVVPFSGEPAETAWIEPAPGTVTAQR